MVRKKHSLVLNSQTEDHGGMTTNQSSRPTRRRRLRDSLREAWLDTRRADRALAQLAPYDDYLFNRRAQD
jgi:hypothetical protein